MKNTCRFCESELNLSVLDLGLSPFANSYIPITSSNCTESFYPLHIYVCEKCFLVQVAEYQSAEDIFSHYSYFSSFSESWLIHAKKYVYEMIDKFKITKDCSVVEIASNDGYLLRFFKEKNIPCLGIEPAQNVAAEAIKLGIETISDFFGTQLAEKLTNERKQPDLIIGNNVLAHVPDINNFVEGLKILLSSDGNITMEFPHVLNLFKQCEFDTIYHEHFSYLSLFTVKKLFDAHGLTIFRAEKLETHGGSLRIFACHNGKKLEDDTVKNILAEEVEFGLTDKNIYKSFQKKVQELKFEIVKFFVELKQSGNKIVAYGAPAKGNTLLNYCGIGKDYIDFTVDKSYHKQNTLLPGSRIPVYDVEAISKFQPDYIIILPWNLKEEILEELKSLCTWKVKFVTLIPEVTII